MELGGLLVGNKGEIGGQRALYANAHKIEIPMSTKMKYRVTKSGGVNYCL